MRSTYKRKEIKEILTEALGQDNGVTLWQFEGDERRIFTGKSLNVAEDNTTVNMLDVDKHDYILRPDEPLYIHGNYKKFVFKRDHFSLDTNNTLTVKTPSELKVEDFRSKDRFNFKYQDHKVFSFQVEISGEKHSHTAILVDLSIKGAGIIISVDDSLMLNENSVVDVSAITDQKLPENLKAVVKYMRPYELGESGEDMSLYRIGLQFEELIDSVNYKSVLSVVEKKQTRVKGLDVPTFCGLDELELDKILANLEATDNFTAGKIKDNLEYLDKLRYLTPVMKKDFLLEVNHSILAVGLRLSSKELIYELLEEVTDTIRDEILFHMKDARPISTVKKSQETIIEYIQKKEKAGEFVLDPETFVTYV